jgi:TonB family protein
MNISNTMRLLRGMLCVLAVCSAQDSPPSIRRKVEPEFSKEARMANLSGAVVVQIVVGTDGLARDPKLIRSLGLGLDENAIAAVTAWQFEPGIKAGQPANVFAQILVTFRLLEKVNGGWRV